MSLIADEFFSSLNVSAKVSATQTFEKCVGYSNMSQIVPQNKSEEYVGKYVVKCAA